MQIRQRIKRLFNRVRHSNKILLSEWEEDNKPVVYKNKVYQIFIRDWDNDCILRDDINGLIILRNVFSGDDEYEQYLIDVLGNDHQMNQIKQIKQNGKILTGKTIELQKIVDLHCQDK